MQISSLHSPQRSILKTTAPEKKDTHSSLNSPVLADSFVLASKNEPLQESSKASLANSSAPQQESLNTDVTVKSQVQDVPQLLLAEAPALVEHAEVPSLSPMEKVTLGQLQSSGPAKSVVVLCDIGRDQDDELALATLAKLNKMGNIDLKGVVTSLGPAQKRGQLAKGALRTLGLPDVPVAAGSAAGQDPSKAHDYEFDAPYFAEPESVEPDGQALFRRSFEEAKDKSMTVLVLGAMTDLANFMKDSPELFAQKAEKVVIMGGVNVSEGSVSLENGFMTPDKANNNTFDMDAAKAVYQGVQDLGVPSMVVTREAAYAAPVGKDFYEGLGDTGNAVGERLKASQKRSIEGLWDRVNLGPEDPARLGLPARCDRSWFEGTFCDKPVAEGQSVWDNVTKIMVYDAVAALGVMGEQQTSQLFSPTDVEVKGTKHQIVGVSKTDGGMGSLNAQVALSALNKSAMLEA